MLKINALLLLLAFVITPIFQTPQPLTSGPVVEYTFGDTLTISGEIDPTSPVEQIIVFMQAGGADTIQGQAAITGNEFVFSHDLREDPLPPFADVRYWLGIMYADDREPVKTAESTFRYEDKPGSWSHEENELISLNWINGDLGFSQQALDAAQVGIQAAQTLLPSLSSPAEPTRIYIYPNARELQDALQLANYSWVAGHADPWLNIVLLSIPAGIDQKIELQRQIPHELMHVWLYNFTESIEGDYLALPAWLNEGLATLVERFSSTGFPALLVDAHAADGLLPIVSLCNRFPSDPSLALLAYAQSASFTRYIHQNYGSSGLENLIRFYADGLECERGVEAAFGVTLAQIEQEWITDTFGPNIPPANTFQATPFLFLFGVIILVPLFIFVIRRRSTPAAPDR